jgi:hypothetical protein
MTAAVVQAPVSVRPMREMEKAETFASQKSANQCNTFVKDLSKESREELCYGASEARFEGEASK